MNLDKLVKGATGAFLFYKANEATIKPAAKSVLRFLGLKKKKKVIDVI